MLISILLVLAGIALLYWGGEFLVDNSILLAKSFGVSSLVIGLTVVAFATSAPENRRRSPCLAGVRMGGERPINGRIAPDGWGRAAARSGPLLDLDPGGTSSSASSRSSISIIGVWRLRAAT